MNSLLGYKDVLLENGYKIRIKEINYYRNSYTLFKDNEPLFIHSTRDRFLIELKKVYSKYNSSLENLISSY